MGESGLSVQKSQPGKLPGSTKQPALASQLQGILARHKSGTLKNMVPLKDFFALLQKGGYTSFKAIYEGLSDEHQIIFRTLITDTNNQEVIFGKGKKAPQEVLEIIQPASKRPVQATTPTKGGSPTLPAALDPDSVSHVPKESLTPDRILVKGVIEQNPLLRMFSESLASSGIIEDLPQGKVLIEQGSQSGNVYVVLKEKSVKVEIFDSTGKVIRTIYPPKGALVGERSVMYGTATNARVTTLPGAKLLTLSPETFLALLQNAPHSQNFLVQFTKTMTSPTLAKEILQGKVKIEICRPGETVMVQDSKLKKYMYIVLDGELGVFDYFGEVRGPDGKPVKVGPGQPVGERGLIDPDQKTRKASVANNGKRDVVLLRISRKTFKALMKSPGSEFSKYVMRFYEQRRQAETKVDFGAKLKGIGFEYKFSGTSKDGRKVPPKVQKGILAAAWRIHAQISGLGRT